MRQMSLESLIRMANTVGATVICEYYWPDNWPSCWNWRTLTCFLNMNDPQPELRWELQRLIFEAQSQVGGVRIACLMHFWLCHVISYQEK